MASFEYRQKYIDTMVEALNALYDELNIVKVPNERKWSNMTMIARILLRRYGGKLPELRLNDIPEQFGLKADTTETLESIIKNCIATSSDITANNGLILEKYPEDGITFVKCDDSETRKKLNLYIEYRLLLVLIQINIEASQTKAGRKKTIDQDLLLKLLNVSAGDEILVNDKRVRFKSIAIVVKYENEDGKITNTGLSSVRLI